MFRLLVRDENLEIVEVALTVVTPWSLQTSVSSPRAIRVRMSYLELLVQIRISSTFLRHLCDWYWGSGKRCGRDRGRSK
jgi:hypothetical protein